MQRMKKKMFRISDSAVALSQKIALTSNNLFSLLKFYHIMKIVFDSTSLTSSAYYSEQIKQLLWPIVRYNVYF